MAATDFDVIVVGAGFAGLYALHRLRESGLSAHAFEAGGDVGGTWFWNRYPGARCDIESVEYSYSFSPELEQEWQWTERYAAQPEILAYLNHVADRFDLRRDISFNSRVTAATWDEAQRVWVIETESGKRLTARYCIMGTGCLSSPNRPAISGLDDFAGGIFLTSLWPHEGVDFTGRRVAVIGTGSSGIQSIPQIAAQAAQLTVFQRTPNFIVPAQNRPLSEAEQQQIKATYADLRAAERASIGGVGRGAAPSARPALQTPPEELARELDERWEFGGLGGFLNSHPDTVFDEAAAERVAEYLRGRIAQIVDDPAVAELLSPRSYPFGSKRLCVDTGYYQTFNRANVELVDLNATPINRITARGIETADGERTFDDIVLATGFDAMTGSLARIDIRGRGGLGLAEKWAAGPQTYLGLMTAGFPNLFMVTGPGSPSVISNMVVSIEQHVEWITNLLSAMQQRGQQVIEPLGSSEEIWGRHVQAVAEPTVFLQANSWYLGANVPGKPRVFMPYLGGVGTYRAICDEIAAQAYPGFVFDDAPVETEVPQFSAFFPAS